MRAADASGSMADVGSPGVTSADGSAPPLCGSTPCDPHANTCCVPFDGGSASYECKPGATASCPAGFGTFHCEQQSDCPGSGLVCCGSYDLASGAAQTQCMAGPCPTVQLCVTDGECLNRQACTMQTCPGRAVLRLCGLQTALGCSP
ncbi:MAG TPA: hypothetical protein VE987_10510 [Polyangiaceae bacterium]|nr:hypothetical protein [Polyangiaceae bacterium]